jgi:L-cystine uptake protein TcyP (sodium:dicarboxylate symporter family)
METQNYANHRQYVPLFHRVLLPVLFLTVIGSFVNLYQSWGDHQRIYSASLLAVLSVAMVLVALFARVFALKAQDRAIRAEESLRHFVLTGKLPDARLTVRQLLALRFAPDSEFVPLAKKAADESMAPDAIKKAIQKWRPDTYRV